MIPFGTLNTDAPAYGSHSTVCNNVTPYRDYLAPFKAPTVYTAASTEAILSAFSAKDTDGSPFNFVGGTAKLQKVTSAAWEDVSKVGGYATASEMRWDWTMFGDYCIATNYSNPPQVYQLGTSTDFADLAGSPPQAKCVATVRGFVMFGNTTTAPNQLHWSALENHTDYTPSVATQSDTQLLYGESNVGEIMRIVGGEYATVFCESGIFRGTYVGGSLIFTFDQIIRGTGTLAGGSVASHGDNIFFLGNDGFYMLGPGGMVPIGEGINKTFFQEVATAEYWRISATIDPVNSLYIVAYPTVGTVLNKILIYNWQAGRWSTATPGDLECLFVSLSEGYTLETLDALVGNPDTGSYANVSVDSALFIGGAPSLSAIDSSHRMVIFNGAALSATFETGETQIFPGKKATVKAIRPFIEGDVSMLIRVGYRNKPMEEVSYGGFASLTTNADGECHLFQTARYQRAQIVTTGEFTRAYGVDFDAVPAGRY